MTEALGSALSSNLIDVPLVFGNMACEPDQSHVQYVYNYTAQQWSNLIYYTFANWTNGAEISANMLDLYASDSAVNPQKAYDRIVADYGLYCSQVILMQQVLPPSCGRKNKIYVYYDGKPKNFITFFFTFLVLSF